MPYTISNNSCAGCDKCRFQCPTGAIKIDNGEYWIDPNLCNNCKGYYSEPQCVSACSSKSPKPLQVKKGRCKIDDRELTSSDFLMVKVILLRQVFQFGNLVTYFLKGLLYLGI